MKKSDLRQGQIGAMIAHCAGRMGVLPDQLQEELERAFPKLAVKERCANCDASMAQYTFHFDCLDAVLVVEMAKQIKAGLALGLDFTVANAVHVPTMGTSLAIRCRTTQCSKLGLITKLLGVNGRHIPGMWLITARGWAAMRGEGVPESVSVFRNEIQERTDKLVTIKEALEVNRDKVERSIAKGSSGGRINDYRSVLATYEPVMWTNIEGYQKGTLI